MDQWSDQLQLPPHWAQSTEIARFIRGPGFAMVGAMGRICLRIWLLLLPLWVALGLPAAEAGRARSAIQPARAQATSPVRGRALGSKTTRHKGTLPRTAKQQPAQPLARGKNPLGRQAADKALRNIRAANPQRSTSQLRPGLERYRSVVTRVRQVARQTPRSVRVSRLGKIDGLTVQRVDLVADKPASGKRPRVLIIGGVHAGTEVVGTETATRFIEMAAKHPTLRNQFDITVIPLLTPSSLVLGSRENTAGNDVNRSFQKGAWTAESKMLRQLSKTEKFDLVIDMHGAGNTRTNGFFLISGTDDGGLGNRILSALPTGALNDVPGANGKPTKAGPYNYSHMGYARSKTGGTLKGFWAARGARYSYTLEAPTRTGGEAQVKGMLKLLRSTLHNVGKHGDFRD